MPVQALMVGQQDEGPINLPQCIYHASACPDQLSYHAHITYQLKKVRFTVKAVKVSKQYCGRAAV